MNTRGVKLQFGTRLQKKPQGTTLIADEQWIREGVLHFYVNVMEQRYKFETITDIYGQILIQKAVIFANSEGTVNELAASLMLKDFTVSSIHAGLTQSERDQAIGEFLLGGARVLIATDSLGISDSNLLNVDVVINYELPDSVEEYLHRVSRCYDRKRLEYSNRKGLAINICCEEDMRRIDIDMLRRRYHIKIDDLPPNIGEILEESAQWK